MARRHFLPRRLRSIQFRARRRSRPCHSSTGSFNTYDYFVDARIGNVFVLSNTASVPSSAVFPTKAPPKPATTGTVVGVDLSGHIGYTVSGLDGFTDSTGFAFGNSQAHDGDIGARAKLFALMPSHGVLWMPYVSATVDQLVGYSNNVNIPTQAALPSGDLLSIQMAKTFAGAELGVEARGPGGWTFGVRGFYTASSDTNIVGGQLTIKIPFSFAPAVAARY